MKRKVTKGLIGWMTMAAVMSLTGCGKTSASDSIKPSTKPNSSDTASVNTKVDVKELLLELSKSTARVGDKLDAKVTVKPTNATNKEFTLASSDTSIATIENDKVVCVSKGIVTITARSKDNPLKKAECKLTVLGTDEEGRSENVFEAEDATLVKAEGSSLGIETVSDERVSNGSVVGKISKGDRIIWGFEADKADEDAVLKIRMMGPSGWLGMWDSIPFDFADFYTIKVNGKVLDTEAIHVEGTSNQGGSADYYNVQDIVLGHIALKAGLNTVTFVYSNRYDTTTIHEGIYNGTLSCMGNIDNITVLSKSELTFKKDVQEAADADPDVLLNHTRLEAEADTSRVYLSQETPRADMSGKTEAELIKNMSLMFGMKASSDMRVKMTLRLAAPYQNVSSKSDAIVMSDLFKADVDGVKVDLTDLTIKEYETSKKDNYDLYTTSWFELKEGDNVLSLTVKGLEGYEYLGALDYVEISYVKGGITPFLNENPAVLNTYTFEAEDEKTVKVGKDYSSASFTGTSVEFKDSYKVDEDKYNNKIESNKIIFGIESSMDTNATLKMKVASPFVSADAVIGDVSLGDIADLWVNGTLVSTPNVIKGTDRKGVRDNFTEVEIDTQVELKKGKNRIALEPRNYTDNAYEFLGALDQISLETVASLSAYKVNFYLDRNTYMDNTANEPIRVTLLDDVSGVDRSHCWMGLYREEDSVEVEQPGSLYWYYPSVGETFDMVTKHPNSERELVSAKGGYFKIVYMTYDYPNTDGGYPVYDTVHISCWNDPEKYGGVKNA